jgi:hypothetical protein
MLAHVAAQVPQGRGIRGADQGAQLQHALRGPGDLQAADLAVPFGMIGHVAGQFLAHRGTGTLKSA